MAPGTRPRAAGRRGTRDESRISGRRHTPPHGHTPAGTRRPAARSRAPRGLSGLRRGGTADLPDVPPSHRCPPGAPRRDAARARRGPAVPAAPARVVRAVHRHAPAGAPRAQVRGRAPARASARRGDRRTLAARGRRRRRLRPGPGPRLAAPRARLRPGRADRRAAAARAADAAGCAALERDARDDRPVPPRPSPSGGQRRGRVRGQAAGRGARSTGAGSCSSTTS